MRFLFAPELCGTPFPKTLPKNTAQKHCPKTLSKNDAASRPSSEPFGVDRPNGITIERGASYKSFQTRFRQSKEAERRQTRVSPASPCGEARTLARARSPVGVPLRLLPGRQLVPKAQRQAMFPGTVRRVRSLTAAPTGGRRPRASPRVLPAPEKHCPSPVSTSHAGHCAGRMMPEPPECRGDEPSAREHRTRSRQPFVARPASLHESEMHSFSSPRGANSRNSGGASHPVDGTRIFFCLFDSRARKLRHCCHDLQFSAKARRIQAFWIAAGKPR